MSDDVANVPDATNASLADKFRAFLEGLSDEEFAEYQAGVGASADKAEVEGFGDRGAFSAAPMLVTVFQDVTLNKQKAANKAAEAADAYIRG